MQLLEKYSGNRFNLVPGELIDLDPSDDYKDVSSDSVRNILAMMKSGIHWTRSVKIEFGEKAWITKIITSEKRHSFFRDHLDFEDKYVLDIGSGWGQLSVPLLKKNSVVGVDLSKAKLEFTKAVSEQEKCRNRFCAVAGSFESMEFEQTFEFAIMNGSLEWVPAFAFKEKEAPEAQMDAIKQVWRALKYDGRLVIGIENRLGLKYLMGVDDDHIGVPNIMTLDWENALRKANQKGLETLRARTMSLNEYHRLLVDCGFRDIEFFCAFPDYKLPEAIIPANDAVSLREFAWNGEIPLDYSGYDGSEIDFNADLVSHYRTFSELGILKYFVPSYYIVARK